MLLNIMVSMMNVLLTHQIFGVGNQINVKIINSICAFSYSDWPKHVRTNEKGMAQND
jgi:hypothetical protein